MKIDLLITELDVGGAEQCLTNLAMYLHRQSHSVRVIAIGPPPPSDRDRLLKCLQNEGIECHFIGARRAWQLPRVLVALRRLIRQSRPDIVQSFLFHANVLAAMAYSPWKIPIVGGTRVVAPSRHRALLSRLAASRMRSVVCVSQSVADYCAIREKIPRRKLVVIHNGVPIVRCDVNEAGSDDKANGNPRKPCVFAQQQLGLSPTTPCLLFVGRIDYQKGADVLLDRADRILTALPLHNIILVGDGPLKVLAQSHASRCEHESRIHFTGRRDDVLRWMRSSQLLLLPTRYEGMPNVVLEAMSCGLPIVSTRAEGILELLGESAGEQTVAVNDWVAWTEKLIWLATEKNHRERLAKANFERCVQQFNLADKLAQYEQLYLRLVPSIKEPSNSNSSISPQGTDHVKSQV